MKIVVLGLQGSFLEHVKILRKSMKKDTPLLATCAGMVLIGSRGDEQCNRTGELLGLIDMKIERNAFGRQYNSFEREIEIDGIRGYPGIFIRAPAIAEINDPDAKILARIDDKIIAVQKNRILGLSFHPELTNDTRIHKKFLEMVS